MNQKTVKLLRKLYINPFPETDSRHKLAFKQFREVYAATPEPDKPKLLFGLRLVKEANDRAAQTHGL